MAGKPGNCLLTGQDFRQAIAVPAGPFPLGQDTYMARGFPGPPVQSPRRRYRPVAGRLARPRPAMLRGKGPSRFCCILLEESCFRICFSVSPSKMQQTPPARTQCSCRSMPQRPGRFPGTPRRSDSDGPPDSAAPSAQPRRAVPSGPGPRCLIGDTPRKGQYGPVSPGRR